MTPKAPPVAKRPATVAKSQPGPPQKVSRVSPENVVPASAEAAASAEQADENAASAASRGDTPVERSTPWGVESSEIAPSVPGNDATPAPSEVQKVIKLVAANVVTTLPAFFKDHSEVLAGLGLIGNESTLPNEYDALPLPTADAAFVISEHTVFRVCHICVW